MTKRKSHTGHWSCSSVDQKSLLKRAKTNVDAIFASNISSRKNRACVCVSVRERERERERESVCVCVGVCVCVCVCVCGLIQPREEVYVIHFATHLSHSPRTIWGFEPFAGCCKAAGGTGCVYKEKEIKFT